MRISDWSSDVCSSDLAIATVTTSDTKLVLTVRTTAFDKASPEGGSGTIEKVASTGDAGLSAFAGAEIAKLERPELTSAKVIVSGGRALQSSEHFKTLIEPLADKLGDRKSVVKGKSVAVRVDLGGGRIIKKKNKHKEYT